mmetsp:Transcript_25796/g.59946  ORF Transcript_25796/g.59946 Transcript_25796/m.59946 type:complete len:111 (+) Transcript_25796:137-469(+)
MRVRHKMKVSKWTFCLDSLDFIEWRIECIECCLVAAQTCKSPPQASSTTSNIESRRCPGWRRYRCFVANSVLSTVSQSKPLAPYLGRALRMDLILRARAALLDQSHDVFW